MLLEPIVLKVKIFEVFFNDNRGSKIKWEVSTENFVYSHFSRMKISNWEVSKY